MSSLCFIPLQDASVDACELLRKAIRSRVGDAAAKQTKTDVHVLVDASGDLNRALAADGMLPNMAHHSRVEIALCTSRPHRRRTIVVCMHSDAVRMLELLTLGFGDVLEYSDDVAASIHARTCRWERIDEAILRPVVSDNLIGRSEPWLTTLRAVAESAMFSSAPVLLTGPTGSGKELLARVIHTLDDRPRRRDLIVVDCTTLARDLAGSELFGHERGAFTGASGEREGAVGLADGGTLFLDEIGELTPDLQAQLLRVLQEKLYRRVGGSAWRRSEFRLVCATNRNLPLEVSDGRFRVDLYHRIAANICHTPSLDERRDDIPLLVSHFVSRGCPGCEPRISPVLMSYLVARAYPGNVRELGQLIQGCLRRYAGAGPLSIGSLPETETRAPDLARMAHASWSEAALDAFVRRALCERVGLKELGRMVESSAVRIALAESSSLTAAASWLGVTPRALHLRKAASRDSSAAS